LIITHGVVATPNTATPKEGQSMMNGMANGMGSWGLLMLLAMLAVLALAVLGGVWLYRRLNEGRPDRTATTGRSAPASDAAQSRLRERYAAGEIDDEEYERRLSALTYWH